ncbi:unnamed protein product [Musa acuminata var. zebrina]
MVILVRIGAGAIYGRGQHCDGRCDGMHHGAGELDLPNVTRQLYSACHHVAYHGTARHRERHPL